MKIVEFISDTNIGGAGVLLLNRLENTDFTKYCVVTVIPRGSALEERLLKIGAPQRTADVKGDTSADIRAIAEYVRILREERPSVVNCHGAVSARIAAKLCRVPVKICTRHCVFPIRKRERIFAPVNRFLSDAFVAVAHSAKQNLIDMGVDSESISVIINGAQPLRRLPDAEKERIRQQLGIRRETLVLGFCARLEKCKGHEVFFEALRYLDDVDLSALLIGDGSRRQALERLCMEYGLEDRVKFCGFLEDVAPLMNIVDININCSTGTETSSLALSEGMSLGIPAVVSDYGGNPYMIKDRVNGFVCRQGDAKAMAECIRLLSNDKKLVCKMGEAAYARFFEELNAKKMTEKTYELYSRLYKEFCKTQVKN